MQNQTKEQLVQWLSNFYNNCGHTDFFGYKMTIEDYAKKISENTDGELSEEIFSTNDEGQKFIESFQK